MYIQFGIALRGAIERCFGTEAVRLLGLASAEDGLDVQSYGILEIEICPDHVEAEITSNICFRISKLIADRQILSDVPANDPEEVARRIIAQLSTDEFSLHVGGRGYLNASSTSSYKMRLLSQCLRGGSDVLFSGSSLFGVPQRQAVNWDIAGAFGRLAAKPDFAMKSLLETGFHGADDRLMLLSVLADEELDTNVYLRNLHGRQNTPWHVRRYLFDVARYSTFLRGLSATEGETNPKLGEILSPSEELILKFRHELLIAQRVDRPERFLREVLSLIKDFYRIFNDPRMRTTTCFPLCSERRSYLFGLLELEHDLVVRGLACLFGEEAKEFLQ